MKTPRRNYNYHETKDRLSDLPDSLLLQILSTLKTKHAVQTCILSTRWKNLWKHLPRLSIRSRAFKTLKGFTKFMSRLLSLRDDSTTPPHTLKVYREGIMEPHILERILKYVVSHNVKRLQIRVRCDIQHFPSCFFSCHALTSLHFYVSRRHYNKPKILFPNSLNLPSLTSLYLYSVIFPGGAEPFSSCPRLKSLMISHFDILGEQNLFISSTTLVELTIKKYSKPKNYRKIELSTPYLRAFSFIGTPFHILCWSHLSSVKHIEIDANMWWNYGEAPSILLSWLLKLADIKSVTISSSTLQVLSLVPNLVEVKLHSLRKLKSMKVKRKGISARLSKTLINAKLAQLPAMSLIKNELYKLREAFKEGSSSIPDAIVQFLIQNSPSAEVQIIN